MIAKLFIVAISSAAVVVIALTQDFAANAPGIATIATAVLMGIAAIVMAWAAVKTAAVKAAVQAVAPVLAAVVPVLETVKKIDVTTAKIDGHVNSKDTEYRGIIATQKREIEIKDEVIDGLRKDMALLAHAKQVIDLTSAVSQATVAGATGAVTPPIAPAVPSDHVFEAIKDNTKETADNTKKTDADAGGGA